MAQAPLAGVSLSRILIRKMAIFALVKLKYFKIFPPGAFVNKAKTENMSLFYCYYTGCFSTAPHPSSEPNKQPNSSSKRVAGWLFGPFYFGTD